MDLHRHWGLCWPQSMFINGFAFIVTRFLLYFSYLHSSAWRTEPLTWEKKCIWDVYNWYMQLFCGFDGEIGVHDLLNHGFAGRHSLSNLF